mmetsp:Transcript_67494/g.186225  ORF Transcript_67494/g.186225 Transcript_67494/m.186225 type:complete len:206 (-) Transcript_67494:564-1181(-)
MPPAPSIVEDENSNMASRRSLRQRPQKRYVEPSSDEDESDSEPEAPTSDEREVLSAVQGSSSRSSKPKSRSSRDMDRAKKLELRKIRNRQSAAASRKRKSDRIDELEAQVAQLLEENERLKSQIGTPAVAADDAQSYHNPASHADKRAKLTPPSASASASASAAAMMARRRTASSLPSSYSSTGGVRSIDLCTNQLPAVYALYLR